KTDASIHYNLGSPKTCRPLCRRLHEGKPSAWVIARLIAQWLAKRSGQQFIIENRPAANLRAWEVGLPWAGCVVLRENGALGRRLWLRDEVKRRMTRLTPDEMYYDSMKARPTRNPPSAPNPSSRLTT